MIVPALLVLGLSPQVPPPTTGPRRFSPAPPGVRNPLDLLNQKNPPKTAGPRRIEIESADEVSVTPDGKRDARGDVRFQFETYKVRCDHAVFDDDSRKAVLEGKVVLVSAEQTVYAERVTIDVDTREFAAQDARTIVPPALIGQNLLQPLEISGGSFTRFGDVYRAKDGFLTTCDLPDKHYKIGFKEAIVYPKKQIVLKGAVLYIEDRAVARIGHLAIPITDEIRYSWLPNVGRTNEEGYFVKAVFGYALSKTLPGLLRVDYMTKKGLGLGFDQAYRIGQNAAGTATFYTLKDKGRKVNNSSGRLNHQQRLGNLDLRIASDFQNNSYQSVSTDSTSKNTTISLNQSAGAAQTGLSVNLNGSSSGTTNSAGTNFTLSRTQPLGKQGNLSVRLTGNNNFSTYGTGTTATDSGRTDRLAEVRASGQAGIFRYELQANKQLLNKQTTTSNGTTSVAVGFSGTERLPELTLSTEPQKLGKLGKALPFRVTMGYGRFVEPGAIVSGSTPAKLDIERFLFSADVPQGSKSLTDRLTASWGGNYRQLVYPSNQAALYTLTTSEQLSVKVGQRSTANLSYGYLRPYGGLPIGFRLDQTGSNNNLSFNLSQETLRTKLNLVTGYDIQRAQGEAITGTKKNPWQNLAVQLGFRPKPTFQTRFTAAYNINSGRAIDLTNQSRWKFNEGFGMDLGLRYDPATGKLASATETLTSWIFSRSTRVGVGSSYNGFTKKFDYSNATFSQRYHDFELTLSYINQPFGTRSEKGLNLGIRLLAFPAQQSSTAGRYGTLQDSGLGSVF